MPYATNEDLPVSIRTRLPAHAQDIFRATFNSAWDSYGRRDPAHREATAHRVAWAAVKHRYHKEGDRWVADA
jgi:cation transport regulator